MFKAVADEVYGGKVEPKSSTRIIDEEVPTDSEFDLPWKNQKRMAWQGKQEDIMKDRKSMKLFHGDGHRMKSIYNNGLSVMTAAQRNGVQMVNPIWMDLPKCAERIDSVEEMRQKLEESAKSDEVMVVRYFQDNCTACNALEKCYEYVCNDFKLGYPKMKFYEVKKEESPELVSGMVRYPQVKAFSLGKWADLDFKPDPQFRETLYNRVEDEVKKQQMQGNPVTALQAEEMYFSAAGPTMALMLQDSVHAYYCQAQARLHNYWKQVSVRRTWFYRKFVEPQVDKERTDAFRGASIFGERVEMTADMKPDDWDEKQRAAAPQSAE